MSATRRECTACSRANSATCKPRGCFEQACWCSDVKMSPQVNSFAKITLTLRGNSLSISENEFRFIIALAVKTVHGNIANEVILLSFTEIDKSHYRAIIQFDKIHHVRIISSLLLFGKWKDIDTRFDIESVAQTPCFLAL